jgi:protein tyrosine phosphatase
LASSSLIADFWYTAWVDAGKPDLSGLVSNAAEKQSLFENELQLFQQNQLIKANKLLAKKDAVKEGD